MSPTSTYLLDPDEKAQLRLAADRNHMTVSAYIAMLVRIDLGPIQRTAPIPSISSSPADAATES